MSSKNQQDCQSCEAESYTRNNYFTGKLMVERDFTDEQRYFREKIRIHHQRLHGTGVVCGLQIVAHEEPCNERYVILQPGSAIDCCGKDILVPYQEVIDLWAFPAMQELIEEAQNAGDDPDAVRTDTLQLCIRYRECPNEEIPVLYDECGCDDSQCAPNRILESYELDLILNPEIVEQAVFQPELNWNNTINIAHAELVYLHEDSNRLYILTADDNGIIYQVNTDNFSIEASFAIERRGLALSVNNDGTALYVIVAHEDGIAVGNNSELWVFDTVGTNLASGATATGEIPFSDNSTAVAQVFPDGRLLVVFEQNNARLRLWDAGIATPDTPSSQLDLAVDLRGVSIGSDGMAYCAEPGTINIHRFDINDAAFDPQLIDGSAIAGDTVFGVVPVIATGPDLLAVVDDSSNCFRLIDPAAGGSSIATVALTSSPRALAISSSGQWAYVLVENGDDSFIQTINITSLRQGNSVLASEPFAVGGQSRHLVLTQEAHRLFAPYIDDLAVDNAGGVAVIDISESNCLDLLWPEDCPSCETSDCLVLATIENYRINFRVLDIPNPAPDATVDIVDGIARIDNVLNRQRLPSTQAIAEALACVLENCCGGSGEGGEQGPPGPPGPQGDPGLQGDPGIDGSGIEDVVITTVPCDEPATGSISATGVLTLQIPTNCNPNLTHICNINWPHAGEFQFGQFIETGLLIRFDGNVRTADIHHQSVRMMIGAPAAEDSFTTWHELTAQSPSLANPLPDAILEILPIRYSSPVCEITGFTISPATPDVNGILLRLSPDVIPDIIGDTSSPRRDLEVRIQVLGDFIRDLDGSAVDGNHLPDWVPSRPSGNHVQGGTFESWFTLLNVPFRGRDDSDNPNNPGGGLSSNIPSGSISVNTGSFNELVSVRGIGPELANAIINYRESSPIRNQADLITISGIGENLAGRIRPQINFDEDGE